MGKSAAGRLLRDRGVPVVDTDDLARQVVEQGKPALAEIQAAFGPDVLAPDGQLRRDVLASLVFADPAARRRLETILHPRIRRLWKDQMEAWAAEGRPLGVVVIPLLFETAAEQELDRVVCVACSARAQRERLAQRGWSNEQIEQRVQAQMPVEKKMSLAHYVIWSEGPLDVHARQWDAVLGKFSQ